MLETGEPEYVGEVRYQAGAVATAVPNPDGIQWAVRRESDGHLARTPRLAHISHWSEPGAARPRKLALPQVPKAAAPANQFYPDCSNNNWNSVQDLTNFLSQLADEGFAGMCHKVSEGSYYQDPYWAPCLQWCSDNNFPLIGYHYVTTDDPAAQAVQWNANNGGAHAMLDWEANGGNVVNLGAVGAALNTSGVVVQLGYCPQWYWEEAGGGSLAGVAAAIVSSGYPDGGGYASTIYANCGGDTGEGWAPYSDIDPRGWQFTDQANIAGFSVDCNAFIGTAADLAALFTGGTPAVTPTPPTTNPPAVPEPGDQATQIAEVWGQLLTRWDFLGGNTPVEALGVIGEKLDIPGYSDPLNGASS